MTELFATYLEAIKEKLDFDKCVLIVRKNGNLAAIATWDNNIFHEGLSISLPNDNSFFQNIVNSKKNYISNDCSTFEGNFFERKLLLNDNSQSCMIQLLDSDNEVVGLIGYSSSCKNAFDNDSINYVLSLGNEFIQKVETMLEKTAV